MESQIKNHLEKVDELKVYTRKRNRAASESITNSDAFDAEANRVRFAFNFSFFTIYCCL